ncbi:MAG TPA: OmpA family protein [Gemmatimonadaceae bacterium]|jgi:outer membrane protein OmpA-like peptidoglycan-associated protein
MATLLDTLTTLVTPATGQLADRLGESEATVSSALPSTFASVLGGLVTKAKDPGSFRQVFDLITSRPAGSDLPADAASVLGSFIAGGGAAATGTKFLNQVFGGQTNAVANLLNRVNGFKNASSASTLLTLAAPLVLGVLGKRVRDDHLDSSGLANVFTGEKDSIFAAMPAGLSSLISSTAAPPSFVETPEWNRDTTTPRQFADRHESEGRKWVWPVIGLATLALVWLAISHKNTRMPVGTAVVDTSYHVGTVPSTSGGEVSTPFENTGAFTKQALPNGVLIRVPLNGTESKLVGFIDDPSRQVDKTTWFELDRVNFAPNSANILPESQEQLANLVAILKAFPNAHVKVGGYTDNVGNAKTNFRLSQKRADAVKRSLLHQGIAVNRVQSEGYGEAHAIGDNSTEPGRAQNRRIALLVTSK